MCKSAELYKTAERLEIHGASMLAGMFRNEARIAKEHEDYLQYDKPIFDEIRRRNEMRLNY